MLHVPIAGRPWFWSLLLLLGVFWCHLNFRKQQAKRAREANSDSTRLDIDPKSDNTAILDDVERVQELYHQLHHLERYPDAILTAKNELLQALDRAVATSLSFGQKDSNILDVTHYCRTSLTAWIKDRDLTNTQAFEAYTARRAAGGPREMFETRSEAKQYLQSQAPLRYVDGAWLGRLSRAWAPWKYQRVLRRLWQTLSEELGDGDLAKHHTHIYHQLLLTLEPGMPPADSRQLIERQWGANDEVVWRSGLGQLIVPLFQDDFLPEILGFNLHFEGITRDMMVSSVEMRELGIDPCYFLLHIAIDNAHSGHTAMALDAVCDFIEQTREHGGLPAADRAWKRVQAGYLLSEGKWNTAEQARTISASSQNRRRVANMFAQKAESAHQVHCTSKTILGGRRIIDWLKPAAMADAKWRTELVDLLGKSRYWITPGRSSSSRFMREILWPGRMFGAFTDKECKLVELWISEMSTSYHGAYSTFVGAKDQDETIQCPALRQSTVLNLDKVLLASEERHLEHEMIQPQIEISHDSCKAAAITKSQFLPALWFAHLCILEGFTAVPSRCADHNAQSAIRMLRSQNGLWPPTHSVTGNSNYDEISERWDYDTLIDIGLHLLSALDLATTESLAQTLEMYPSNCLVQAVMDVSVTPYVHPEVALGMASSFGWLYRAVAQSALLNAACCRQLLDVADVHDREAAWFLNEHGKDTMHGQAFIRSAMYVREGLQRMARPD